MLAHSEAAGHRVRGRGGANSAARRVDGKEGRVPASQVLAHFGKGWRPPVDGLDLPGFTGTFTTRLGAARFPETTVIFDDGTSQEIAPASRRD